MNRRHFVSIALTALLLTGCGPSTSDNYKESQAPGGYILFDSDSGNIPYPNDILMDPQSGKIHFDTRPEDDDYVVKSALNTLDGFSTTSPLSVGVSNPVDPASLQGRVQFLDIDPNHGILQPDFVATASEKKIAIVPTHPLQENNRYLVILLKGITNEAGRAIEPDYVTSLILGSDSLLDASGNPKIVLDDDPAVNLEKVGKIEAIRQHTQQLIAASGVPVDQILDIWSFKTQSIGKVAQSLVQNGANDAFLGLQSTKLTSKEILLSAGYDVNDTMYGIAEVYAGRLANIPYYLGIPTADDPTAPLTKSFSFPSDSDMPEETGRVTIPVLAAVPNAASGCEEPDGGWPVAIFQHGITRNRLDVLAISEAFAKICYAVVGIDLPLHGIFDPSNPLYDEYNATTHTGERTFDLDFLTQDANETILAKVPDGKPDTSGVHYMNFTSLLTTRDNVRQSTSDYVALYNAILTAQKDINGLEFDENRIVYVGHSLGTIAAFGYFSYQESAGQSFNEVLLSMPGGGVTDIMLHSQTFGETVINGLKEAGLEPGTSAFNAYINAMQTILDDADPLNFAALAATKQKFLIHAVKNDDVIPNTIPTSPMAGGLYILKLMGAVDITSLFEPGETVKRVYTDDKDIFTLFAKGDHRSLFIPDYNLDTTIEMQTQMDSFILSQGALIDANLSRIVD
ncbi:hypothetical protein [Hydrogenimonas urashimensis]|uniref:hypothetical protein n=1 Tax=Hydrogenimonas urashimensis TaxID=2740515 RepID=UPI001915BDB0|nr:hypothetical protein [Hydrogenimonas urashimensis]